MDFLRPGAPFVALVLLGCKTAEPPPPAASARACTRVDAAEARAFEGLQLMGTIGTSRLYGRPGQMLCSEPGAGGRGECEIVGASQIRIEFPSGASGFRTDGREPVVFTYSADGQFSCRGLNDTP